MRIKRQWRAASCGNFHGNGARLRNAVAQGLAPEIVLLAGFFK
jgi:hypothetical protein